MSRNKIIIVLGIVVLAVGAGLFFGGGNSGKNANISHYTCPMHPQIKADAPGSCPICGMTLVPVLKEPTSPKEVSDHDGMDHAGMVAAEGKGETKEPQGIQIDPTAVQNIGVKLGLVTKRNLVRLVSVYGKTAHDPELWTAEQEYIEALNLGDHSLIAASERRLEFLGLSKEWVALLRKNRKADQGLFLPDQKGGNYFEAFLQPEDIPVVQNGQTVSITDEQGRLLQEGHVVSVGVMVDPNTRLTRALIHSDASTGQKANRFVRFQIQVPLGEQLSLPREAVLYNGDETRVYRVREKGIYIPTEVTLGETAGEYIAVKAGLEEGETVVTNGHFLIDSETQIRTGGEASHEHVH